MMTLEEYRVEIKKSLKKDYKIDEEYINKLDGDINRSYAQKVKLSEMFGADRVNPNGYCYMISMMYPDLP